MSSGVGRGYYQFRWVWAVYVTASSPINNVLDSFIATTYYEQYSLEGPLILVSNGQSNSFLAALSDRLKLFIYWNCIQQYEIEAEHMEWHIW